MNLILTSLAIVKAKIFNILRTHKQMIERYRHSKKIEPPKITVNSLDEEWMENALAVVNKHLSDDKFSTDIFAREMLMSRTSLYTKMKALTGESVKEFIRRIRLNTAAEMILRNEHSIAEISFLVGLPLLLISPQVSRNISDVSLLNTSRNRLKGKQRKKSGKKTDL